MNLDEKPRIPIRMCIAIPPVRAWTSTSYTTCKVHMMTEAHGELELGGVSRRGLKRHPQFIQKVYGKNEHFEMKT